MSSGQTLVQRVRAKHPGAYDDLSDEQLDTAVRAKFPGVYDDLPRDTGGSSVGSGILRNAAGTVADVAIGAGKRLVESGVRGGAMLRKTFPILNTIDPPRLTVNTTPANAVQEAGGALEQVAEVINPSRAVTRLGASLAATAAPKLATAVKVATEAAGGAALATAQGGDPLMAAGLSAAIPVVGSTVGRMSPALRTGAEKKVEQALGATKERFKAMAKRLTPEVLRRGLGGSRTQLLAAAAANADEAADLIDDALQQFGAQRVGVQPIVDALEHAKDAFRTTQQMSAVEAVNRGMAGRARDIGSGLVEVDVIFEPRAVTQLQGLQRIVSELGDSATVSQMVAVRRAWDKVVDQAGGFSHRAGGAIGIPLKEQTEAWAKREATGAIRTLLNAEVPELAVVNKEFAFWKSLKDVLTQTVQRTAPQGPGLGRQVAEVAGAAAGSSTGLGGAFVAGKVAQAARGAFTSPRWRLFDARMRDRLASAIANGSGSEVMSVLARVSAIEGSKVPAMMASH